MTPIIEAHKLGKRYRIGSLPRHNTLRDTIAYGARSFFSKGISHQKQETHWALKDVSFAVNGGDAVGVIGRNGAGKSTLLKLLSRITEPTEGSAVLRGRAASMLEVGTGFHPELTGRENIFLNGAIMGMSRAEVRRKFDEIVQFAEVEKFLDTPVKRYSSGMYVRLAFAVAAHLDPEILIVDEVLAVGDAQFQKKCLGKMREIGKGGRTVLFVSHNLGAISSLTQKCILLENGRLAFFGDTLEAVSRYLADAPSGGREYCEIDHYRPDHYRKVPEPERAVVIREVRVNGLTRKLPEVPMGEPVIFDIALWANKNVEGANISLGVYDGEGRVVTILFSWDSGFKLDLVRGKHVIRAEMEGLALPPGRYYMSAGVNQSTETTAWDGIKDYPAFEVKNTGQVVHWLHRPWGAVHWENVRWTEGKGD